MTTQPRESGEKTGKHTLQLFVIGGESNSRRALENIKELFEKDLKELYELQVIDVLQDYQAALDAGVLVAPMLILRTPKLRIVIAGDLSDKQRIFATLQAAGQEPE